ncbi:outer membrane protein assembly factor BamE [uncultured Cohaesibacter sp.]|uniref:outer membrane protein assembly factor BamE n=1 Tax=uncultured Cohaesibacter sp. TaxID=1002546 RepID=UPI0029C76A2F|nr:outer membrane protein assembly factor BamE [uncultured Cohaesibacter sp.]
MRNVRSGFHGSSFQKAKSLFSPVRAAGLAACLSTVLLSGCFTETTSIHGFVPSDYTLDQITEGASREQVMLTLGTPSTTADFGGEVFYYISQTRKQPVAFMRSYPVDQTVVAVYFDDEQRVSRTARYGLKDGKLFDFSRQVTPTGGKDTQFLSRLVEGIGAGTN